LEGVGWEGGEGEDGRRGLQMEQLMASWKNNHEHTASTYSCNNNKEQKEK